MANTWRYWRYNVFHTAAGVSFSMQWTEIEMRVGGVDQIGSGTLTVTPSGTNPNNLIDNNTTTFWVSQATPINSTSQHIILYDFGGSEAAWKALDSMTMRTRNAGNVGINTESYIQCSHDNTNWITVYTIGASEALAGNTLYTFNFSPPSYANSKRVMAVIQR